MKIETTVNMHKSTRELIEKASKRLNKSENYIIRMLLGKLLHDKRSRNRSWTQVKYQQRDIPENWSTFHVSLREDEYEYSRDLSRVYKMSFSHVLAYAAKKYIDSIIEMLTSGVHDGQTDNYLFKNYMISYKMIDGVHCWRYCWGYTPEVYSQPAL